MWVGLLVGLLVGALTASAVVLWYTRLALHRSHRLAQRARANERLAELGTLAAGLAHEIKNPLSTVGLNVQLLDEDLDEITRDLPGDSPLRPPLARLQRRFGVLHSEIQRLRDILEDFLRFAGRMKLSAQQVDINALVDELVDFFSPQADQARVRLRTQLDAQPPTIHADPGLLKQALLNLLINATQAITSARADGRLGGASGEVHVRTNRVRSFGAEELHVHVTDTGPGMDAQTAARAFSPYFTKRKDGTGLGLPTTRRIIEEHGGTIDMHTEPGRGTDFTIQLPTAPPAP